MSQLWKLAHERALNETREALKLTEDRLVVGILLWGVWLFFVWMHEGKAARLKLLLSLCPPTDFSSRVRDEIHRRAGQDLRRGNRTNYRAAGTARSKGLISAWRSGIGASGAAAATRLRF